MRIVSLKLFIISLFFCQMSHATIVQMQTDYGDIEVNLFDETTPITVANFLAYIDAGSYEDLIIHRLVGGFVMQSGGYNLNAQLSFSNVPERAPIQNEPVYSNVRGTIAMAKLGGNANSATSEWFINLVDNSANLDVQNGGFTVFGQVTDAGMDIVDTIAALPKFNFGGASVSVPLQNFTVEDANNGKTVELANHVLINSIQVVNWDEDTVTPANLSPVPNTLITQVQNDEGGSLPYLFCLALSALLIRRQAKLA